MIILDWFKQRRIFMLLYSIIISVAFIIYSLSVKYDVDLDYCAPSTPLDDSDCCRLGTIESLTAEILPILEELLPSPFFRYYKANLSRPCPFWKEDLVCTSQGCSIATLPKDPTGLESKLSEVQFPTFQLKGKINRAWEYDDDDFCLLDGESETGVYVDLIENPERFTGYSGPSANRVWQAIYRENCFAENPELGILRDAIWQKCVERNIFYRVVSGLHASISVHLADEYWNSVSSKWESNFEIFNERVGKHVDRIQNMYLVHMLLYRAVVKIAPKLSSMTLSTRDDREDDHLHRLIEEIVEKSPSCPEHFDHILFSSQTPPQVIEEFKDRFREVTRIMDCVSCERCRLWGKIQTTGVGTALKVLFLSEDQQRWEGAKFRRSEIIALFNTLGRLSESVDAVQRFRRVHIMLEEQKTSIWGYIKYFKHFFMHPMVLLATCISFLISVLLSYPVHKRQRISK